MKYNFSLFVNYLFLFLLVCFASVTMNHVNKTSSGNSNYTVRVVLVEQDLGKNPDNCSYDLKSKNGFLLSDGSRESKVFYSKSNVMHINIKNNFIYVNDKKYLKDTVRIAPKDGDIHFGKYFYQGDFLFILDHKKLFLINKIDLEDYVFAVLCSESWPKWPLEANKAFAVAIRTYVTKRAQDAKRAKRIYHIKNTNSHQTYRGHKIQSCEYAMFRRAVSETSDYILTYKGDIIDALYDCCCGGVIPANIEGKINFKKAPYLARSYACPYCKRCGECRKYGIYSWTVSYGLKELEKLLDIENIKSISIEKKDKAGLVKEVKIKTGSQVIKMSGGKFYMNLKLNSGFFSLKTKSNKLIINGNGQGHGFGMCFWGAKQMVAEGSDFKQILAFYYPSTHLSNFPRD